MPTALCTGFYVLCHPEWVITNGNKISSKASRLEHLPSPALDIFIKLYYSTVQWDTVHDRSAVDSAKIFIINQATFSVAYMCIRYCWCIIIDIFNNEQVREIDAVATLRACNSNKWMLWNFCRKTYCIMFDISFAEGDDLSLLTFHDVLENIDSIKVTTEGGHRTLINGE